MTKTIFAADLFCGAGGTSTGLVQACKALGYDLELLAINHWERAVETHAANHPEAKHLCASLSEVDPSKEVTRRKLDLLVASPECTHHSLARGGKPRDDQSRASAWHVLHWCERLRVENVIVENVPEFKSWGPLNQHGKVISHRKGEIFDAWVRALEALGYEVSHRILNCADHGDPTTRKRLFITATRRHQSPWPAQTHAQDPSGHLQPWVPAKTIIDWKHPSQSIFGRKRPLAAKTMARIQEGLRRYGGEEFKSFVLPQGGGGVARCTDDPLPTVATKGAIQLVQPFIVPRYGERPGQAPRTHDINSPMPTIPATNQHHLCQPFLISYYGTGGAKSIEQPVPTLTGKARFGLVETKAGQYLDIHMRMLQPHELSAAMSFPQGYVFSGTKTERIKQIGNAVPVSTAQALCEAAIR